MTQLSQFGPSREWVIDQKLDDIVRKIVAGNATDKDRENQQHLIAERTQRMMPAFPNRYR